MQTSSPHPRARPRRPHRVACGCALAAAGALLLSLGAAAADGGACIARSLPAAAPVVELYTSEGCSSCPPADRWLSRLKDDPAVVALAFHVDFWDRLGWRDRYAAPAHAHRQAEQQAVNGSRYSYTPQVVLDGIDRRDWSGLRLPLSTRQRPPAPVDVTLTRQGERVVATVLPGPGAPRQLAAYWALTENGHETAVRAGENQGETLRHDHVVRDYRAVAAWTALPQRAETFDFREATRADPAHPRQINLVVTDAATGRPLQAVKLGC